MEGKCFLKFDKVNHSLTIEVIYHRMPVNIKFLLLEFFVKHGLHTSRKDSKHRFANMFFQL